MRDKTASHAVRAYCASQIVDRGYGKAPQQTQLNITSTVRRAADLSDDELAAIIQASMPKLINATADSPDINTPPSITSNDEGGNNETIEPSVEPQLDPQPITPAEMQD